MATLPMPSWTTGRLATLLGTNGHALDGSGADARGGFPGRDGHAESVQEQRERAQQEFKRVWSVCTRPH